MTTMMENFATEAEKIFEELKRSEIANFNLAIVLIYPKVRKYVVAKNFEELNLKKEEFMHNNPILDLGPPFSFTYLGKATTSQ